MKTKSIIALTLIASYLSPSFALAGVISKMTEVEPEAREELEAQRALYQECQADKYRLEAKSQDLDSRMAALASKIQQLTSNNENLQKEMNNLKLENQDLISQKLAAVKPVNSKVSPIEKISTTKVETTKIESAACEDCIIRNIVGPLVAVPVGIVTGTARGLVNKGLDYSEASDDKFGDGKTSNIIAKTVGFIIGGIPGAITGFFKGIYNGIRYGITKPFTQESFSVDGELRGWDPYDII